MTHSERSPGWKARHDGQLQTRGILGSFPGKGLVRVHKLPLDGTGVRSWPLPFHWCGWLSAAVCYFYLDDDCVDGHGD